MLSKEPAPRLRASIQSPLYERTCMGPHDRQIFLNLARARRFLELPTEPIDFSIEILE